MPLVLHEKAASLWGQGGNLFAFSFVLRGLQCQLDLQAYLDPI